MCALEHTSPHTQTIQARNLLCLGSLHCENGYSTDVKKYTNDLDSCGLEKHPEVLKLHGWKRF